MAPYLLSYFIHLLFYPILYFARVTSIFSRSLPPLVKSNQDSYFLSPCSFCPLKAFKAILPGNDLIFLFVTGCNWATDLTEAHTEAKRASKLFHSDVKENSFTEVSVPLKRTGQ